MAIGLLGPAVDALTLGGAQLVGIPARDHVGTLVIALAFGGIVQILAGITDIRYHQQLGGTGLTMYGFFWNTVCTAKLVGASTNLQIDMVLFAQNQPGLFLLFCRHGVPHCLPEYDPVRPARRQYRDALVHLPGMTGSHKRITPRIFHIFVGLMAFYHAVVSPTTALTGQAGRAASKLPKKSAGSRRSSPVSREAHLVAGLGADG